MEIKLEPRLLKDKVVESAEIDENEVEQMFYIFFTDGSYLDIYFDVRENKIDINLYKKDW